MYAKCCFIHDVVFLIFQNFLSEHEYYFIVTEL